LLVAAILAATLVACSSSNPDALWEIVSTKCVPGQLQHDKPAPCVSVVPARDMGHVVLKDLQGEAQMLVMPATRVTGIEDPQVLEPRAGSLWTAAWETRPRVAALTGGKVPLDGIGLTLNPPAARSQNQLHIHVDCMRPDVMAALSAARPAPAAPDAWVSVPLPGAGGTHAYALRRIGPAELPQIFRLALDHAGGDPARMARQTVAVVALPSPAGTGGIDLLIGDTGSAPFGAEELQDHRCPAAR
jgi:CDP-diacylglycerol pyrophosphatase